MPGFSPMEVASFVYSAGYDRNLTIKVGEKCGWKILKDAMKINLYAVFSAIFTSTEVSRYDGLVDGLHKFTVRKNIVIRYEGSAEFYAGTEVDEQGYSPIRLLAYTPEKSTHKVYM